MSAPDDDLDPTSLLDDDDDSFDEAAAPGSTPSEDFEDLDEPELMCGIFKGHISDVKDTNKPDQVIVECKSETPGTGGETAPAWCNKGKDTKNFRNRKRLFKIAEYAGVPVGPRPDGRPGKRLLGSFYDAKNKSCMFIAIVEAYNGDKSSKLVWGMPKPGASEEWDAFAKAYNGGKGFTPEQVAALKDSPGIINPKHHHLFS